MKAATWKFLTHKVCLLAFLMAYCGWGQTAWINEIHYDNNGGDVNEAIEVVIENPVDLHSYELVLYNNGAEDGHIYLDSSSVVAGEIVGDFFFFSWYASGGIQNGPADGVALIYNGSVVAGQFLSYEGTMTATEGPAIGMTSIDIGVSEMGSDPFYTSLQLIGTGSNYLDFSWNSSAQATFGNVNSGQILAGETGNAIPVIFNISQNPIVENVTPNDAVGISAEVFDMDGISSVVLSWGTISGNLSNTISMDFISGNYYETSSGIPPQDEGTQIFYTIGATDNNSFPGSTTTEEKTYIVGAPAILGWQITNVDVPFRIDFESTVANINEAEFAGIGFQPFPEAGQLDSNSWAITGFSDGDLEFGGSRIVQNEDYTQEIHTEPVGTGGIYAFAIGSSICLGIQPGGDDFTPGTITLRLQNQTDVPITGLRISYDIFVRNDQNRSNSFNFSYSYDNENFINTSATFSSQEMAMDLPYWKKFPQSETITGISIVPQTYYYLRWTGNDEGGSGSRDEFGLDNIELVANPVSTDYVYNNGWLPENPNGIADKNDNISIQAGTANFEEIISVNNIQIANGAILQVEDVLKLYGTIVNNGSVVFVGDGTKLGQLAPTQTSGSISGTTVQRYVPARRAFRFVSPAVNSTATIHANWQEGAVSNTANPFPGFGTHITGSLTDQTNGFDATGSGNPSLFLFNNDSQEWYNIANTNVNTLEKGKAYRLFVRGDRSIDLTNNETVPTNTILRATGNMVLGGYQESLAETADYYNFIGNPFQAIVNMNEVLANSTNLNPNNYYIWDPNMNERGGYVTVALPLGTNAIGSGANQFLQPGQAAFVRTLNDGEASILFEQTDKSPLQNATNVFRQTENEDVNAGITLQLFEAQSFLNEGSVADGFRLNFKPDGNNTILPNDAPKMGNIDENVAVRANEENYLSIANRAMPIDAEIIQLFANQYRHTDYTFKIEVQGFPENTNVYLKDDFLEIQTELANNTVNLIDFYVDENNAGSVSPDRFSFVFEVNELSTSKMVFPEIILYPNPVKSDRFFILLPENITGKAEISIYNSLGQEIYTVSEPVFKGKKIEVKPSHLQTGAYWVKVRCGGKDFVEKILFF